MESVTVWTFLTHIIPFNCSAIRETAYSYSLRCGASPVENRAFSALTTARHCRVERPNNAQQRRIDASHLPWPPHHRKPRFHAANQANPPYSTMPNAVTTVVLRHLHSRAPPLPRGTCRSPFQSPTAQPKQSLFNVKSRLVTMLQPSKTL